MMQMRSFKSAPQLYKGGQNKALYCCKEVAGRIIADLSSYDYRLIKICDSTTKCYKEQWLTAIPQKTVKKRKKKIFLTEFAKISRQNVVKHNSGEGMIKIIHL